jgi:uncharacterized membrane protein
MFTTTVPGNSRSDTALWVVYALYFFVVTAPIGFLINVLRIRAYKRQWCESDPRQHAALMHAASHHQWLMTTFIATFFLCMVVAGTFNNIGGIVAVITAIWWLSRLARGMGALVTGYALPLAIDWPCEGDSAVEQAPPNVWPEGWR